MSLCWGQVTRIRNVICYRLPPLKLCVWSITQDDIFQFRRRFTTGSSVYAKRTVEVIPRLDLVFKKIFGVEENKRLLISLINSIVSKEDQVVEVDIQNPYNFQNLIKGIDKLEILDIKAVSENDERFNIEIQITDCKTDYDERALFYWGKLYTEQLKYGESYFKLRKTIRIHILNYISILESKQYHNVFHIIETNFGSGRLPCFTDLELHTIELTKFGKSDEKLPELTKRISNQLDIWCTFLTESDLLDEDDLPQELNNPFLKEALKVLQVLNFTPKEYEAYEARIKFLRDERSDMEQIKINMAELKVAKAKVKVLNAKAKVDIAGAKVAIAGAKLIIAEDKAEGKDEATREVAEAKREEAEAKAEAKREEVEAKAEAKRVAENLLESGLSITQVAKITGFTIKELDKLYPL